VPRKTALAFSARRSSATNMRSSQNAEEAISNVSQWGNRSAYNRNIWMRFLLM
jgi:hypothetical protein